MVGSAISVSMMTEAPTMPVVAAMMVPMMVTDMARPPGMRRVSTCSAFRSSSATPDFSRIVPMKTNIGTAISTGFCTAWPKMRGIRLPNWAGRNTSNTMPRAPNASATPPRTNATG